MRAFFSCIERRAFFLGVFRRKIPKRRRTVLLFQAWIDDKTPREAASVDESSSQYLNTIGQSPDCRGLWLRFHPITGVFETPHQFNRLGLHAHSLTVCLPGESTATPFETRGLPE